MNFLLFWVQIESLGRMRVTGLEIIENFQTIISSTDDYRHLEKRSINFHGNSSDQFSIWKQTEQELIKKSFKSITLWPTSFKSSINKIHSRDFLSCETWIFWTWAISAFAVFIEKNIYCSTLAWRTANRQSELLSTFKCTRFSCYCQIWVSDMLFSFLSLWSLIRLAQPFYQLKDNRRIDWSFFLIKCLLINSMTFIFANKLLG